MIEVTVRETGAVKKILFSGDLGRFPQLILRAPETPEDEFDYMLLESTYGDRLHPRDDVGAHLAPIVEATAQRGGTVVIPSFAVGRTQELLYLFRELIEQRKMPSLPIHVDSPMAIDVTDLYRTTRRTTTCRQKYWKRRASGLSLLPACTSTRPWRTSKP